MYVDYHMHKGHLISEQICEDIDLGRDRTGHMSFLTGLNPDLHF